VVADSAGLTRTSNKSSTPETANDNPQPQGAEQSSHDGNSPLPSAEAI
jgi:hypothetical protein